MLERTRAEANALSQAVEQRRTEAELGIAWVTAEEIRWLAQTCELQRASLALGSAAQMRLEITIARGIEPDLVERQQAAGHRVRGRLTDPHRPGALVEGRCVRVRQNRQPPGAAPPRLSDRMRKAAHGRRRCEYGAVR